MLLLIKTYLEYFILFEMTIFQVVCKVSSDFKITVEYIHLKTNHNKILFCF